MLEIEAKVRVKNLDTIAKQLGRMGARFLHTVEEQDFYFNSCDGKLLKSNCGLRLRKRKYQKSTVPTKQNEIFFLTYKGPTGKSSFKSRREVQVEVGDFETMKIMLLCLGYKELIAVRKIRHIWQLGKCEICLDKVCGLGIFVEIEGPSEKAILGVLDKLGLDKSKHIPAGYARMTAEKRSKNHT
jgi:adenylate cyclase class 2